MPSAAGGVQCVSPSPKKASGPRVASAEMMQALDRIIEAGASLPLSGEPRPINGHGRERYVYAPADGRFETVWKIGANVAKGEPVARIGDEIIRAPLDGCPRGITHAGASVQAGTKVVEIDPRGDPARSFGIAERPGKLALAVLAAVAGFCHKESVNNQSAARV